MNLCTSVFVYVGSIGLYKRIVNADTQSIRIANADGQALAVWTNGCQLISDGVLEINGLVRPAGGQNEAFFNCRWGFGGTPGKSPTTIGW